LILLAAGIVSVVTGDAIGGSIIVAILAFSIGLDTVQEGHAVRNRYPAAIRGAQG
jgi:P-type Mg2+ transporter